MDTKHELDEEITLKEIIITLKDYLNEMWNSKWLFVLLSFLMLSALLYKHYNHKVTYNAKTRFVIEGQSGSSGGLSSLLGSFGIKKGGKVNPYKVIEIGKSTQLLNKILFDKDELANGIIDVYKLQEKWTNEDEDYSNFKFEKFDINSTTDNKSRRAFKKLSSKIWGGDGDEQLATFKLDEDTGIYTLSTSIESEELSLLVSKKIYNAIKLFFEEEIFQNQKQSTDILLLKKDSIESVRNSKIYELARFEDNNRNLVRSSDQAKRKILNTEISALNIAYSEVLKNYEMTDVNLKDIQPLFLMVDAPYSPLSRNKSSLLRNVLLGLVLGFVLAGFIVTLRKLYREIMK